MKLEGGKIILRDIALDDAERYVAWFSDPEVTKFLQTRAMTLEEERKFILELPQKSETERIFAIEVDGIHVGGVGLRHINKENRNAELGIMIGDKKYWEKGIGKEAMATMLNYAFNELKLHRVELAVYEYNPRATHLYESLNFLREGVKREHVYYDGKFYDEIIMGILESEWNEKKN